MIQSAILAFQWIIWFNKNSIKTVIRSVFLSQARFRHGLNPKLFTCHITCLQETKETILRMPRLMTVTRAPAQWSHMRPGPRHHHTSSATMWQYVTIPWVCGDHCSCNVTRSINMFYPVLINTHTRWHRTRVTRIWGMSHTTHILSTTFFGDRGHWQLWPVHQTCIRPQWWQHFLGFWWWRAGLIRESWTKNFLWGDNPGWQARAGNCLPTFLTAASLPSFLRDGDTPLKILMT